MTKLNRKSHMYNKKWKTAADVVVEDHENNLTGNFNDKRK